MKTHKHPLRTWLDNKDLTQDALADRVGISAAHMSQIISGSRRPSLDLAARLEDETGIPARDFAEVA